MGMGMGTGMSVGVGDSMGTCLMPDVFTSNYFVKIDLTNYTIKVPDKLSTAINSCKMNNKRYFVIPMEFEFPTTIELKSEQKNQIHNGVMIIDTLSKVVEYFEPYGPIQIINFNIQDIIFDLIEKLIGNGGYTLKNVQLQCSSELQHICLARTLLLLHLRILNINLMNSDDITNSFLSRISLSELTIYIKRYINYLKNTAQYIYPKSLNSYQIHSIKIADNLNPVIKERIKYLLKLYYNYKIKDPKIFEELASYSSFPYFQDEFIKFFNSFNFF
jgi:hypothetical protein